MQKDKNLIATQAKKKRKCKDNNRHEVLDDAFYKLLNKACKYEFKKPKK
jgi:hypothetical protein